MSRLKSKGTVITITDDDGNAWTGAGVLTGHKIEARKVKLPTPPVLSGSFKMKLTSVSSTPLAAIYEALTGESFADRDVLVNGQPVRAHKVGDLIEKEVKK